jgi:hypothetical protein
MNGYRESAQRELGIRAGFEGALSAKSCFLRVIDSVLFIVASVVGRFVRLAGIRNATWYNGRLFGSNSQEETMHRIQKSKAGIASEVAGRAQSGKAAEEVGGLVLDDILVEIRATRWVHRLPEPKFGLEQIEREPRARSDAERIIKMTLDRHARKIYSRPDTLFVRICDIRRGKQLNKLGVYSRWRIPPIHAANILRTLLEKALQTIVQLPKKDAPLKDAKPDLKRLALHCEKLANEMGRVFKKGVVCHNAMVYFSEGHTPRLEQFYRQVQELRRNAETIRAILVKSRSNKQKMDSPNPQVRLALSLVGWLETSTGRKQYERLKRLLYAAYAANGMETPPWVDRLEIEMTRDRTRRKAFAKSITVQSPFPIPPQSLQNQV